MKKVTNVKLELYYLNTNLQVHISKNDRKKKKFWRAIIISHLKQGYSKGWIQDVAT